MSIVQTPLVQILIALIVVGVLLWLVNTFIPMAGSIKSLLNAVVVIVVVVWLLNIFGLMHYITNFHVNRMG
ncbi:MAG: Thivi_2564 family membrane protein [Terriglobia bacterium]